MRAMSVRVENFNYISAGVHLLRDISFFLSQGDWLSVIGPNGSGKSTLLKSILGLAKGSSGRGIHLFEKPLGILGRREIARYAAYVPQMLTMPPFSVREFLAMSGYAWECKGKSMDKVVSEAMEQSNIAEYAHKPMRVLSGGILRRVFLAAAVAQGAEILVLDEPYSFLDPPQALEMNRLLKRLNREEGKTILMATHDLNLALDGDGLGLILRNGEQLAFGALADFPRRGVLDNAFDHEFRYFRNPHNGGLLIQP